MDAAACKAAAAEAVRKPRGNCVARGLEGAFLNTETLATVASRNFDLMHAAWEPWSDAVKHDK